MKNKKNIDGLNGTVFSSGTNMSTFALLNLFLPGDSFNFKFVSELLVGRESDEENLHTIVFVQNLETKEALQTSYVN
jgi:hypothetical protein